MFGMSSRDIRMEKPLNRKVTYYSHKGDKVRLTRTGLDTQLWQCSLAFTHKFFQWGFSTAAVEC